MQDITPTPAAVASTPDPGATAAAAPDAVAAGAPARGLARRGEPWVVRSWRLLLREPSLMVAVAYLFVSFIGLWASVWFYRTFDLPILDYMQAGDYLVAGLRDPAYAVLLASSTVLAVLITWPEFYRTRHPQRVAQLRRRWWWRLVFPEHRWLRWQGMGMSPVSGVVFAVFWGMIWACTAYVAMRAVEIRDGAAGNQVEVTLAGENAALPGQAKLLGTTSAFVLLWWPQQQRAEAIPVAAVKRLASLRPAGAAEKAQVAAADPPGGGPPPPADADATP